MAGQPPSRPTIRLQHEPAPSSNPQRRITIKINPLKARTSTSSPSNTLPPTSTTQDVQPNVEERKPRPIIRIKPLRQVIDAPKVQEDQMVVDSPVREPSPPAVASPVDVVTPTPQPVITESFLPPATPIKPKAPRPIKLKPLKEVLLRLITQIKKKDAYAFFLQPVDPEQVPGYSDVVKTPMDFGTMTEKVEKGKYRSLEQFKDDFLLVTMNAKTFNPPSTMYHTEASKIEAMGLEQISRASTQVIEYEADWSVDIVADGEPIPAIDQDDANATPGGDDISRAGPSRARSPSVLSSAAGMGNMLIERSRRAKSKKIPVVTENFEEGWHLPGYKDGIGIFSPCSPLAYLMLELKLIGKKWTKKERLKREKEGPPYTPEGSLDYYELQQPFSFFNSLLPDDPKPPEVIPLVSSTTIEAGRDTPEASQPPDERVVLQPSRGPPEPVAIPLEVLSSIIDEPGKYAFTDPPSSIAQIGGKKLRHWTITRNPPRGTRAREDEDDGLSTCSAKRRRVESTDFGSFATLIGTVAAENGLKASDFESFLGQDEQLLDQIRQSIENKDYRAEPADDDDLANASALLRNTVYGGVDGLAYFRSLAEFVGEQPVSIDQAVHGHRTYTEGKQAGGLGVPLSHWVLDNILDPLSHGNHPVLRTTASILATSRASPKEAEHSLANFITKLSCNLYEENSLDVSALATTRTQLLELKALEDPDAKIEIADILRAPEELFLAESAWAGNPPVATQGLSDLTAVPASSAAPGAESSPTSSSFTANGTPIDPTSAIGTAPSTSAGPASGGELAAPSVVSSVNDTSKPPTSAIALSMTTNPIDRALIVGADALRMLSRRASSSGSTASLPADRPTPAPADSNGMANTTLAAATPATSTVGATSVTEDAITRQTRLGLIALAKRAPIDRIARLPPELVPVHIRHIVPTLGS